MRPRVTRCVGTARRLPTGQTVQPPAPGPCARYTGGPGASAPGQGPGRTGRSLPATVAVLTGPGGSSLAGRGQSDGLSATVSEGFPRPDASERELAVSSARGCMYSNDIRSRTHVGQPTQSIQPPLVQQALSLCTRHSSCTCHGSTRPPALVRASSQHGAGQASPRV